MREKREPREAWGREGQGAGEGVRESKGKRGIGREPEGDGGCTWYTGLPALAVLITVSASLQT